MSTFSFIISSVASFSSINGANRGVATKRSSSGKNGRFSFVPSLSFEGSTLANGS